jgi:hypothetical protein
MRLSEQQLVMLATLVEQVSERDKLGCDGCYELMDQFADAMMAEQDLHPSLQDVRAHLEQCRCCRYEYQALLLALREVGVE